MSTIRINQSTFHCNNITISGEGKVTIDGKLVSFEDSKEINITVQGDIEQLQVECCNKVSVTGNATNINTKSGDVEVSGNVNGNIQTMSGDVQCGNVGGNISTMSGDVTHAK